MGLVILSLAIGDWLNLLPLSPSWRWGQKFQASDPGLVFLATRPSLKLSRDPSHQSFISIRKHSYHSTNSTDFRSYVPGTEDEDQIFDVLVYHSNFTFFLNLLFSISEGDRLTMGHLILPVLTFYDCTVLGILVT